jgi:hypothetical protein
MLDRFRERAETFLEAWADEEYRARIGQARRPVLRALFDRSAGLFGPDQVTELQRLLAASSGEDEQRIRFLLEFCLDAQAGAASAEEVEQRRAGEALGVRAGERHIPLGAVPRALADAADPEARGEIAEAYLDLLHEEEDVLAAIVGRHRGVVEELGYGSYVGARSVLSGIDLRGLAQEGARFLEDTDAAYRELLAWFLPRLADVSLDEASWADAKRLVRAQPFDPLFPGSDMVPRIRAKMGSMGLDPLAAGRIRIDLRPDLEEIGGADCHPLRVPELIALTVAPRGGRADYSAFLHQLGYALHRAYTSPELPMEFRWLGDDSVSLGYALTFQGLLATPAWMGRVHRLSKDPLRDYLRFATLVDLLRVRTWIARLHYELAFHDAADTQARREAYVELLSGATGLRHDPREYLGAMEPGFRVARRLRAAQLHGVLAEHLRDRFDEDWFRNPGTGPALTGLFRMGRRFTAPQLGVQLSSAPLSFGPLRARLEEWAG